MWCRLAWDNIGLMDWREDTPVLFQRFMSNFGLPVFYKKLGVALRPHVLTSSSIAKWMVSALSGAVLDHLAVLMAAVSSYYHPTSQGAYSDQLVLFLTQLVHFFMLRLKLERYENEVLMFYTCTYLELQSSCSGNCCQIRILYFKIEDIFLTCRINVNIC